MAPKPKKTAKMPTGERPKQLSTLAKTVKSAARGGISIQGPSAKPEILTASQAAARAGKIRKKEADIKSGKASTSYSPQGMSNRAQSDTKERAMKKQLSKYGMSKTEYGYKLNAGKPKRKPKAGSEVVSKVAKTGAKVAGKVAGRAKTTAREARDVATAVGTAAQAFTKRASNPNQPYAAKKQSVKNLATQVKEVGRAAVTGRSGTTSGKIVKGNETNRPTGVSKGKKRK